MLSVFNIKGELLNTFDMHNTLKSLADQLKNAKGGMPEIELAAQAGITRQSVARILSGKENFSVNSLLAMAESLGQTVLIVPSDTARALAHQKPIVHIPSMTDGLKDL